MSTRRDFMLLLGAGSLQGGATALQAQAPVVLRMGFETSFESAQGVGAVAMARATEELSQGQLKIQIFADSQLGSGARMLEMVKTGELDIFQGGPGIFSSLEKRLNVFDIPFLFLSAQQARSTLDGPVGQEILDAFEPHGLKALSFWETGMRDITNNLRPIQEVEDLSGMKMRIPVNNPAQVKLWSLLGTRPVPLPFGRILEQLKSGAVDAQEHPIGLIYSGRLHTAQKYLSLTGHLYTPMIQVMNLKKFAALSPSHQGILRQTSRVGANAQKQFTDANDKANLAAIWDFGLKVNTMDEAARLKFRQKVRPAMEASYVRECGDAWLNKLGTA